MKYILVLAVFFLVGCGDQTPEYQVNPEGPWYYTGEPVVNYIQPVPEYICSEYYMHQYVTKHTVPIICGSKDGECGIIDCECVCHKKDYPLYKNEGK